MVGHTIGLHSVPIALSGVGSKIGLKSASFTNFKFEVIVPFQCNISPGQGSGQYISGSGQYISRPRRYFIGPGQYNIGPGESVGSWS